jgi:hypothetical protein
MVEHALLKTNWPGTTVKSPLAVAMRQFLSWARYLNPLLGFYHQSHSKAEER